jgi:hypothetical protein
VRVMDNYGKLDKDVFIGKVVLGETAQVVRRVGLAEENREGRSGTTSRL